MSKNLNILLVDQQQYVLKVTSLAIEAIIRPRTAHFFLCNHSDEALSLLENREINLAIIDLDLGASSLDGITLSHKISKEHPEVSIMLLTPFQTNYSALNTKNLPGIDSIAIKLLHAPGFRMEILRLLQNPKSNK